MKLWRQIGKLEATIDHKISVGKLVSSLLRDRLSRRQKVEEVFQAILTCRYVNERWWDLLPLGSNTPLPPVRGPARGGLVARVSRGT